MFFFTLENVDHHGMPDQLISSWIPLEFQYKNDCVAIDTVSIA